MTPAIPGIHHVTAIASDPQKNLDFYAGVLGLRLVKKTVNFDDPGTYHFYYGDELGRPGTLLTFFAWGRAPRGRAGAGQAVEVAFAVPEDSLEWWGERLARQGIAVERLPERSGEAVLGLHDPDGLALALVAHAPAGAFRGWAGGPAPAAKAIRGLHGVSLCEGRRERTREFLASALGLRQGSEEPRRWCCVAEGGGFGTQVELLEAAAGAPRAAMGVGAIHHVAWRVRDDAEQAVVHEALLARRLDVTPVLDRCYFHSIYFHEPGGVLFEIATDAPGFTVDEAAEELGSGLRLPPWLEPERGRIESALPPVRAPEGAPR